MSYEVVSLYFYRFASGIKVITIFVPRYVHFSALGIIFQIQKINTNLSFNYLSPT